MKRVLLVTAGLLGLWACGSRWYSYDEARLMVASSAKEACSCVFILGFDHDRCADYSRLIGPRQIVTLTVDHEAHTVQGDLLGYHAKARWVNAELGCVLLPEKPVP